MTPLGNELAAPRSAILACDARLSATNYLDDQVWELRLGGREPGLLVAQTNFGLRARAMRIFPRFSLGSAVLDDPAAFFVPPRFIRIAPGYCSVSHAPFFGLDVIAEYRVPSSQVLLGRIRITNQKQEAIACRMELAAQLISIDGEAMSVVQAPLTAILRGRTGNLHPVLFLTGGPEPGSGLYPSLSLEFRLNPGKSRQVVWALASTESPEESLALARKSTARPWDAEAARIEQQDRQDQVAIQTGDADWDAVLAHSQRAAYRLFHTAGSGLPCPSFVLARTPEMGFSRRRDGSDYNYLSNGQTALDALHIAGCLLPGGVRLVEGVLRNFLAARAEDGAIDWKPGLGGQRSKLLSQPLLAELAWQIFRVTGDRSFLAEVYPALSANLAAWFSPRHDRDQDGYPEWEHLVQTGLEDSPLFNPWHDWSQGVHLTWVESPGLASLLYNECSRLEQMAGVLGKEEDAPGLLEKATRLKEMVQSAWDPERASFLHRDRDTHASDPGEILFHGQGPSEVRFERVFDRPRRLVIRIRIGTETTRPVRIRVSGQNGDQNVADSFSIRDLQWAQHRACLTTTQVYSHLQRVELDGFDPLDDISIETVDFTRADMTTLLPLWAGVASSEQAESAVRKAILDASGYGQPFGLPVSPGVTPFAMKEAEGSGVTQLPLKEEEGSGVPSAGEDSLPRQVLVQWNALVIAGLVRYGFRQEAADLIARLMRGMAASFQEEGCLHANYDAFSGRPGGEREALSGLFPVRTFLDVLGVELISPREVHLVGNNPFPWPVTVKYRGMKIFRQASQTLVTFPDGQTATVTSPEPHRVREVFGADPFPKEKEDK